MQAASQALAEQLLERGGGSAASVLVIGRHADIDAWLADGGLPPRPAAVSSGRGSAQVWTLRAGDGRSFAIVSVRDTPSLAALTRPLPHYGRESWLVFDGARAIERGVWPSQPQVWELKAAAR